MEQLTTQKLCTKLQFWHVWKGVCIVYLALTFVNVIMDPFTWCGFLLFLFKHCIRLHFEIFIAAIDKEQICPRSKINFVLIAETKQIARVPICTCVPILIPPTSLAFFFMLKKKLNIYIKYIYFFFYYLMCNFFK